MSDDDLVDRLRMHAKRLESDNSRDAGLMREAAMCIERLRSIAGAVSNGQSVAQIKEHLRKCADRAPSADAQS